jgi:hypothetical protein
MNKDIDLKPKELVVIDHMRKSHQMIYSSPYHQCIEMLTDNTKLVLIAIALDLKLKGQFHANLSEVVPNENY